MINNFSSVVVTEYQRCFVDLEPSYTLWVALNTHSVYFVSDFHGKFDRIALFVYRDQPPWFDTWSKLVKELTLLTQDWILNIKAWEQQCDNPGECRNIGDQFVRVEWTDGHQAFPGV